MSRGTLIVMSLSATLLPTFASAQIDFPKTGYYLGMGDSVAAGEGALPVTGGYVYDLYDHGVFGRKDQIHFANVSVRGARSWDLVGHQVPQVVCAEPSRRPTVVTITAGANDFLRGDTDVFAIALRIADAVSLLLNNVGLISPPVLDPVTSAPCSRLDRVTILVSNYYSIPHPVPAVSAQLDAALQGFDLALRYWLASVSVPEGSRVAIVDLYKPSLEREGLVTIERRLGFGGVFDFDVHPTNVGHSFIAGEFERVWQDVQ